MEYNEIRRLLDRYFDGETTLDEEQALRRFFASTADVPADLRYAAPMFAYAAEKRTQTRPVAAKASSKRFSHRLGSIAASVAAAACIVLGAMTVFRGGDLAADIVPEQAYCYLDGRAITDRAEAERVARGVLDGVQADLKRSSEMLATVSILAK